MAAYSKIEEKKEIVVNGMGKINLLASILLWKTRIPSLLVILILSACSSTAEPTQAFPAETHNTPVPTETSRVAATTAPTATVEATSTAKTPKVEEHDIDPESYTELYTEQFMGVEMTFGYISDGSLGASKIKINESFVKDGKSAREILAESTARRFFRIWWSNGQIDHSGTPKEDDFQAFMADWVAAQSTETPDSALWEKVQFTIPGVNDLNDGDGYSPDHKITVWPMVKGETQEGIIPLREFDIVLVKSARMKNITLYDWGGHEFGMGTNLDGDKLYVYITLVLFHIDQANDNQNLIRQMSAATDWLTRKDGDSLDKSYMDLLMIKVANNTYRTALEYK